MGSQNLRGCNGDSALKVLSELAFLASGLQLPSLSKRGRPADLQALTTRPYEGPQTINSFFSKWAGEERVDVQGAWGFYPCWETPAGIWCRIQRAQRLQKVSGSSCLWFPAGKSLSMPVCMHMPPPLPAHWVEMGVQSLNRTPVSLNKNSFHAGR